MILNCDMGAAYISEGGGRHWRMIHHAQLKSDTRCRPAFHPADANVVYASSRGQLRISRDRGKTFRPIGNLKEGLAGEIAIHPSAPDTMLLGTHTGHCWLSRDAGTTWSVCSGPNGPVLGFHFDSTGAGRVMFAATEQGIWRSDDQGRTWRRKTHGLPSEAIRGFAGRSDAQRDLTMLYCTTASQIVNGRLTGGVYRSRDRGETWQRAMGRGINAETRKADRWAYGPIAHYRQVLTTDANPLIVYATNTSTGFSPPHHNTLYRSDDGGQTWRDTFFVDPRFKRYNVAPNYVTASTGQSYKGGATPFMREGVGVYRSRDGAETWEKISASQPFLYTKDLTVHPQRSRELLVGVCDTNREDKSGGLYRTTDGGKHWHRIGRQGRQTFGGYFHPQLNGWIYMTLTEGAPGAGLWLSRDNGRSWQSFDDLPFANIQRVQFDPSDDQQIDVTTFGGSVWRGPAAPHQR